MKRTATLAALAALAMLMGVGGVTAQDATLDEVLQCHYEIIGGVDAWKNLETMKAEGIMVIGGGMEAPFTMYSKRPRMQRIEFTVQGMTGIQAFDGETGWMLMPFMGQTEPEQMPEDQVRAMREDSDMDGPLVGYEEEGNELELLGTEDVEGTPAHELKVTLPSGEERLYFLETEYCLPIKIEGSRERGDQTIEFETILGDYKEVDGLVMAHSIESRVKGMPQGGQTITITDVEVNVPIADSLFVMPGG